MKTLGFIVNPISGMGGAVGLKGTDGEQTYRQAIKLGANPVSRSRATDFLSELKGTANKIHLLVGSCEMGENAAIEEGLSFTPIGEKKEVTKAEDTKEIANKMIEAKIDLLVFCGGDGTAVDLLNIMGKRKPVLGVPTGVKMHSSIFAVNPVAAARLSTHFLFEKVPLTESEIMDVDEDEFRAGRISARLHGFMLTPYESDLIQRRKLESPRSESELRNQAALGTYITQIMKEDTIYIIGPGTTTRIIGDLLNERKTLLGVDLFLGKSMLSRDASEKEILRLIKGQKSKIIVTPVGGQGFIFGRGNQQISSKVIRAVGIENIMVVSTRRKIREVGKLRVDTGDSYLDNLLGGTIDVTTDYDYTMQIELE